MDSVRLGRVLGRGARGAARTLLSAVDAATAPNPVSRPNLREDKTSPPRMPGTPSASRSPQTQPAVPRSAPVLIPPTRPAASPPAAQPGSTSSQSRPTPSGPRSNPPSRPSPAAIAAGTRRFGQATWSPIARLSGVLWLEFTGVFFGIFALSAATGAWRLRTAFQSTSPGDPARSHLVLLVAVAALFTWFCASSFVRARRRGRRA